MTYVQKKKKEKSLSGVKKKHVSEILFVLRLVYVL